MTSLKIWHSGDRSQALCATCDAWRDTMFRYRTVRLQQSRKDVADVLVAVCATCGGIAAVPQQSAPRLRDARRGVPSRVDARIPKELRDVVGMLAAEFGGEAEPFAGGMVRYYLRALVADPTLAKRVAVLARSDEAAGTPGGRRAFRLDKGLLDAALLAAKQQRVADKSALVRGIIVAAKHDAYDTPNATRREALKAIAIAAAV